MKPLGKFLIVVFFVTGICLYYINGQSALLSLSYEIDDNQTVIERLLDENNNLAYNAFTLKSPSNLERELLLEDVVLCIPDREQIVYLAKAPSSSDESLKVSKKSIFSLFDINRKAEAEPIEEQ
ncbi:MAG: hypothetical protein KAU12_02760 [Candidatus Omnitrophica bacterium]|nr:hypothetical protein [Candidatus Omnitrophota bacterium]